MRLSRQFCMARNHPEKLAQALRANLRRRKAEPAGKFPAGSRESPGNHLQNSRKKNPNRRRADPPAFRVFRPRRAGKNTPIGPKFASAAAATLKNQIPISGAKNAALKLIGRVAAHGRAVEADQCAAPGRCPRHGRAAAQLRHRRHHLAGRRHRRGRRRDPECRQHHLRPFASSDMVRKMRAGASRCWGRSWPEIPASQGLATGRPCAIGARPIELHPDGAEGDGRRSIWLRRRLCHPAPERRAARQGAHHQLPASLGGRHRNRA